MTQKNRPTLLVAGLAGVVLVAATIGALVFRYHQLGWFGETVSDMSVWQDNWQTWIDRQTDLNHPTMVHWIPPDCLCRFFTAGHAADLSRQAPSHGYRVFQAGEVSISIDLAAPLSPAPNFQTPGPLIVLTNAEGLIRYLGPYSDGLTCSSGNSLVTDWLPQSRDGQAVTLDVTSCRCLHTPD